MSEESEEYLIYNPVSFIAPPSSFPCRSPPTPKKPKEPRRRKNAIVQLERPSVLEAIRQTAINQHQQREDIRSRIKNTDRKVSTDSYFSGSDSPNEEELNHEPLPKPARRRLSEGVKRADGSYVSEEQNIPRWQLREKTKSACFDYTIDELFTRVGGGGNVDFYQDNSTSLESFNSTTESSTSSISVSSNNGFSTEGFTDFTGTESETDVFSPYSSYPIIQEDATTEDTDKECEHMHFTRRISMHRRPSTSIFRKFSMTVDKKGKQNGHIAASSSCPYLSTCTDEEPATSGFIQEANDINTPCAPVRRNRMISLPATINNTLKPEINKPIVRRGRKLSLEQSIEKLTVRSRKP